MRAIRSYQRFGLWVLVACLAISTVTAARAQDEHRRTKVPLIGKIAGGSNRQAFSGKVQAVDTKRNLLLVDTVEGAHTEYFPVKKNFEVTTAGGGKIRVSDLQPGTNVIVYYQVKDDRRSVSDILVLGPKTPEKEEGPKKPSSPS
jgi:hypothetical protein